MKPSSISLFHPSLLSTSIFILIGDAIRFSTFVFLVLHSFPFPKSIFCSATDSISLSQKVPDGKTIVSDGGVFELGFFSPNGSINARYVGIWLKNFPNEKVVWVANREHPVRDSSGALKIGADGNLVIADAANNTIWSTGVTNMTSNETVALLSDLGNLVLKENRSKGQVLWESFNHPTDSFLPGMKLGINKRTGEQLTVSSWKDATDPSVGNFYLVLDSPESPQFVIMNGSAKHWRTGQWTGRYFIGVPSMVKDYRTGFTFDEDHQEGALYFKHASFDDTIPLIIYLDYTGDIIEVGCNEQGQCKKPKVALRGTCDLYNSCGSFRICSNNKSPVCQCLKGYEPKSKNEWSKGNSTSGCFRRTKFQCERNTSSDKEKADGFFALTGMKLPDFSHYIFADDIRECNGICLKNCSCLACAYVDGLGCMLWGDNLIDLQELRSGGQELHIRLAYSELDGETKLRTVFIVIIAVSVTLLMIFVTGILCRQRRRERAARRDAIYILMKGLKTSRDDQQTYILNDVIAQGGISEVPSFSFRSIESATDKFSATRKLGEGGFGPVYKGTLSNGQKIAVKRLSRSSGQGVQEFKNEVLLISKLQHRSLVKLLGFCIKGEERMLIYEYMPNKSLDKLIFGSSENAVPDWSLRYTIIEGIARGLLYLHRDSKLKIIHRDLKTSNILLDEHMNPKISDFGMARIFGGDQSKASTNRIVGTYGYMPPEYAMQGIFSEKSDVFSFGVLLLEVVSSKRINGFHNSENFQSLLGYAWQLWDEGRVYELLDSRLDNSRYTAQVTRCIHIALLCVQQHANDRPTMSMIVSMLCNEMSLPSPGRPAFSSNERLHESNPSLSKSFTCSGNGISITSVGGR